MQFFSADGSSIEGPREWDPAVIDLGVEPDDWESVGLTINGIAAVVYAARRFGESRTLADWPRSGPGAYRLVVETRTGSRSRTVTVGSAKLGVRGLADLIEDLERRLPASIALGLQRAGGLVGLRIRPPAENTLEQEVLRLRRAVEGPANEPGLLFLVPAIAADPHSMLARENHWVRRERARRVSAAALVQTLTRPGNIGRMALPERVLDSRVQATFDVYENRLLKAFIQEVLGRLRRLERVAADSGSAPEIRELRRSLQDTDRRAGFLRDVAVGSQAADRLTMVLVREPRYRALLDRFQELHRSLWVELDDDRLEAPLQNLPSLYQSWGTLHLIDALLEIAVELGFHVTQQRIVHRRPGAVFLKILRDGVPAVRLEHRPTGASVILTPERSYGRGGEQRSVSFVQRPDVTVEIRFSSGHVDLLLFDPKYKLDADDEGSGIPIKSDVDKMHSYRDAIRDAEGQHLVRFAATIYPGRTQHYGRDVAAIGAVPGAPEEVRGMLLAVLRRYMSTGASH